MNKVVELVKLLGSVISASGVVRVNSKGTGWNAFGLKPEAIDNIDLHLGSIKEILSDEGFIDDYGTMDVKFDPARTEDNVVNVNGVKTIQTVTKDSFLRVFRCKERVTDVDALVAGVKPVE